MIFHVFPQSLHLPLGKPLPEDRLVRLLPQLTQLPTVLTIDRLGLSAQDLPQLRHLHRFEPELVVP